MSETITKSTTIRAGKKPNAVLVDMRLVESETHWGGTVYTACVEVVSVCRGVPHRVPLRGPYRDHALADYAALVDAIKHVFEAGADAARPGAGYDLGHTWEENDGE